MYLRPFRNTAIAISLLLMPLDLIAAEIDGVPVLDFELAARNGVDGKEDEPSASPASPRVGAGSKGESRH